MSIQAIANVALQSFGGLFSFMIVLCMSFYREKNSHLDHLFLRILYTNIFLQLANILAWFFDGWPGTVGNIVVHLSNFFMFLCSYLLIGVFTDYISTYIKVQGGDIRRTRQICWTISVTGGILLLLSQVSPLFYGIDQLNVYYRGNFYWISNIIGIAAMLPGAWMLIQNRKWLSCKEQAIFYSCYLLPVAAAFSHIFLFGAISLHLVTTFIVVCIYIFTQAEQAHIVSEKELELEKSRTAIMLSQIQPHFLYNVLIGIKELCDTGEQNLTSKALEHFTYYLRGNMNSLTDESLIEFKREIIHVKDYLYLEKIRFEEKLNIVWELNATDFLLPPLTLQPIVENAVRHGITEKRTGGTLTIRSEHESEMISITVTDDGVGFETEKVEDDSRTHIGIKNVRNRLSSMCGGTLIIESQPGRGTTARILLPEQEVQNHENHSGR